MSWQEHRPRPVDAVVVGVLLAAAWIAVAGGHPDGPTAALYLFPVAWTLPLLVWRTLPSAAALCVFVATALESQVAQEATESIVLVPVLMLAFGAAGWIPDRGRAVAVGLAGVVLGVVVVASNPGPLRLGDVTFLAIVTIPPFAVGVVLRGREQHADALRMRTAELEHEREEQALAAVADERARIARELHDVVGHAISVMTVQAGAARMLLEREPERARESLLSIESAGRQALSEMRRMLEILRRDGDTDALEPQPGLADLDALVGQARASGIPVDVVVEGRPTALPPGLDLAAYRTIQEALTNVRRHAAGSTALVRVRYEADGLVLDVENSGAPRPLLEAAGGSGHGLIGMRERIGLYGGELSTGPIPEGGFAVHARLPLVTGA